MVNRFFNFTGYIKNAALIDDVSMIFNAFLNSTEIIGSISIIGVDFQCLTKMMNCLLPPPCISKCDPYIVVGYGIASFKLKRLLIIAYGLFLFFPGWPGQHPYYGGQVHNRA